MVVNCVSNLFCCVKSKAKPVQPKIDPAFLARRRSLSTPQKCSMSTPTDEKIKMDMPFKNQTKSPSLTMHTPSLESDHGFTFEFVSDESGGDESG